VQDRRSFLQTTAGFTAASVALGFGRAEAQGDPVGDCDCSAQSAVPLFAAAFLNGRYLGLAASEKGPRLFALAIDGRQQVSLEAALEVDLPKDFSAASLGVAKGRLVLGGGVPFLWDSYEVDDELDDELRAVLKHYPPDIPTSGTRLVEVIGIQPAAFALDPPGAHVFPLPEMPRRLFGTVGAVAETDSGALVVLVEHSGELTESWYAAAVDVHEERHGEWAVQARAADLGESGPNYLAVVGDDFVVGLNTVSGPSLLARPGSPLAQSGVPSGAGRILGVVGGTDGFRTLATDARGRVKSWALDAPFGGGKASAPIRLAGDEIVGAVPVAGTPGQNILLGRRSALLVKEDRHVL
jgi:hypothetical protein